MEKFQKECIGLIKAAFVDQPIELSFDFDWEKVVEIAKKHNIASILFYGAIGCNVPEGNPSMQELQRLTLQNVMVSLRQMHEIERIELAFQKEKIDYMPLKGVLLKALYPKPEMRTMGDADILIKLEQNPKIKSIMNQLGFEFQRETDHELIWKSSSLFLELHKSVMTTYNKDFYSYFDSGWKFAEKALHSSRYEMSNENFYIYMFVHFTKHYRISGIGIKHILDLWVYMNACPNLDWEYIANELKKMNLHKFHTNVIKTIDVWFNSENETEETNLITNVIFNSGQYGNTDTAVVNRAMQNFNGSATKIKISKILKDVFLPYRTMKKMYKILNYVPFLLPITWIIRCFDVLLKRRSILKRYMKEFKLIDSKHISENERALFLVGLDFHCED